jgi:hypothetical protein
MEYIYTKSLHNIPRVYVTCHIKSMNLKIFSTYLPKIKYFKVNLKFICFENRTNVSCVVLSTYLCVEGIENLVLC